MGSKSLVDSEGISVHARVLGATDLYVDLTEPQAVGAICSALDDMLGRKACTKVWQEWSKQRRTGRIKPCRIVVPLERFGGTPGASGAQVYAGYYRDAGEEKFRSSKPFLIEAAPRQPSTPDRIKEEYRLAKLFAKQIHADNLSQFALPLYVKTGPGDTDYSVLLAPYSSASMRVDSDTAHRFTFSDLWSLLLRDKPSVAEKINEVLTVLRPTHLRGRTAAADHSRRNLVKEYEWYLRQMHTARKRQLQRLFGSSRHVQFFGEQWPNPLYVVERYISPVSVDLMIGPIHGDLHPKNIVLGRHDEINLIDFYWSKTKAHILKDYLLLEANLRFVTMPPWISLPQARRAAEFCINDMTAHNGTVKHVPRGSTGPLKVRFDCVAIIRQHAKQNGLVRDNWITEYLCPLFLVTFGLMRHLENVRNQTSAILTLLNLGKQVEMHASSLSDE